MVVEMTIRTFSDIVTKIKELTNKYHYLKSETYSKTENDILLNNKVDKIEGKGLSTNDYTTTEKTKLANIDNEANKIIVDNNLSESSTNPVQNRIINTALNDKVNQIEGKGLSTEDYTTAEKTKLSGITAQATKNTAGTGLLDSNGTLSVKYGTTSGTACQGNDNRLSNARTPTAHNQASSTITDTNTYSNIGNVSQNQQSINSAIDTKIGALLNVDLIEVVGSLSTASANTLNKLYLVAESTSETNDNYEIFITVKTGTSENYSYNWEKVDTARLDLSDYATVQSLNELASRIDDIVDGDLDLTNFIISGQASKNVVTDSNGRITTEPKPTIPTKTSDLTNDSNFLTQHQDISGKEDKTNKITSFNNPTDTQYPSAKLVSDNLNNKINKSSTIGLIKNDGSVDTTQYLKDVEVINDIENITQNGIYIYDDGNDDVYSLSLTSDKNIIQINEVATITALLKKNNIPLANKSIIFNGQTTITTNNSGEAIFEYVGTGIGDIEITATYRNLLQETYVIYDIQSNEYGIPLPILDILTQLTNINEINELDYDEDLVKASLTTIPLSIYQNEYSDDMEVGFFTPYPGILEHDDWDNRLYIVPVGVYDEIEETDENFITNDTDIMYFVARWFWGFEELRYEAYNGRLFPMLIIDAPYSPPVSLNDGVTNATLLTESEYNTYVSTNNIVNAPSYSSFTHHFKFAIVDVDNHYEIALWIEP